MARLRPLNGAVLAAALALAAPAAAADPGAAVPPPPPPLAGGAAAIQADALTYDRAAGQIEADGDVVVAYGLYRLRADRLVYDRDTGAVQASGDVRVREPDGNVISGTRIALSGDFANGVIDRFGLAFADGSRLAAARAERSQARFTRMTDVAFTPCDECGGDEPLWALEASRVTHDSETRNIRYRNAALKINGVPVAYTPYLAHPDPTVTRRAGLLAPQVKLGQDAGLLLRNYYHRPFSPSRDVTVEGSLSSRHGPLVGARYRQRLARGKVTAGASLMRAAEAPPDTDLAAGALRGHTRVDGELALTRRWRLRATSTLTRDSEYLDAYDYGDRDLLETGVAAERFTPLSYARVRGAAWQDLRSTGQRPRPEPVVLPAVRYAGLAPTALWDGHVSGTAVVSALHRGGANRDVRRAAGRLRWQRRHVTRHGLQWRAGAQATGAAYWYSDAGLGAGDGTALRVQPVAELGAAYPLIARYGWGHAQLRPEAALFAAPDLGGGAVPREDASIVELATGNLFAPDRAAGFDQRESGYRAVYGVAAAVRAGRTRGEAFLGRSQALDGAAPFPNSGGLDEPASDIVGALRGRAGVAQLAYRLRADPTAGTLPRQEATLDVTPGPWTASADYVGLAALGPYDRREELTLEAGTPVTATWDVTLIHTRRFDPPAGVKRNAVEVGFNCDCLDLSLDFAQTFDPPGRAPPDYQVRLSLALRNLGQVGE